jgi:CyaY protein
MSELEFLAAGEAVLAAVEASCDRINDQTDADIDNQRSGSMVTLTFANQSQIIINLQKPLKEIWLAAKAGGFHYCFKGSAWRDTKRGSEFFADLSEFSSTQAGASLKFNS